MSKESTAKNKSGFSFSWLLALLFGALFILIFFQNQEDVEWTFLWNKFKLPLSLIITINFTLGLFLGILLILPGRWRLFRSNRKLKKEIESLPKLKKEDNYISKNDI